jgi:SAM-dependent methyltransferase
MTNDERSAERFITDAFWIVLGREIHHTELRDQLRGFEPAHRGGLLVRLLSSPEFRLVREAWTRGVETGRDLAVEEAGLRSVGTDEVFVQRAYECLLGRPADDQGLQHYAGAIRAGDTRESVLRSLTLSDEFARRYAEITPEGGVVPCDVQLCELANPAKWDNPEWLELLRSLGLPDDKLSMHRKSYEFTQLLFACRTLGALREDAAIISVGAGHEPVLYWLANHVGRVVATDMYEGVWQSVQSQEGDAGVVTRPQDYAPFPYRRDRLTFLKMDGRQLAFRDGTFDVAYSLSSIEHFGGLEGAADTLREMARVLKPGGVLAIATEYVIAGPPHPETFQPAEIHALIERAGLPLVQPIDDSVYRRYAYAAVNLYRNPHQTPHMVVRMNDTIFTTVFAFLRKEPPSRLSADRAGETGQHTRPTSPSGPTLPLGSR